MKHKTIKRIYASLLSVISIMILFIPTLVPSIQGAGLLACVIMGSIGIIAVIQFLQFNDL